MKRKTTLLALLISAAAASLCLAGDDAFMGTWKLNESKSNIPADTSQNNTVVYAQSGDEVTITGDGVDGAGKAVHQVWTGKFDGKEYAAKGAPNPRHARLYKGRREHAHLHVDERWQEARSRQSGRRG